MGHMSILANERKLGHEAAKWIVLLELSREAPRSPLYWTDTITWLIRRCILVQHSKNYASNLLLTKPSETDGKARGSQIAAAEQVGAFCQALANAYNVLNPHYKFRQSASTKWFLFCRQHDVHRVVVQTGAFSHMFDRDMMIHGLHTEERDYRVSWSLRGASYIRSHRLFMWSPRRARFRMSLLRTPWSMDFVLTSAILECWRDNKVCLTFASTDYLCNCSDGYCFKCTRRVHMDPWIPQWCTGPEFREDNKVFLLILLSTQMYFHTSMSNAVPWSIHRAPHVLVCQLITFISRLWLASSTEDMV